jgi:hypothetical protein
LEKVVPNLLKLKQNPPLEKVVPNPLKVKQNPPLEKVVPNPLKVATNPGFYNICKLLKETQLYIVKRCRTEWSDNFCPNIKKN